MIFCIIDTETTGLDPKHHEVIQVAAILCNESLSEIGRTSFRIRPKHIERAEKGALAVNGYHPRTWNPKFFSHKKALVHLSRFLVENNRMGEELVIVGQNVKFDINFLVEAYDREGLLFPFSLQSLDLIDVSKVWSQLKGVRLKKHSLTYLSELTGCVNRNPHDAEADADVTLNILRWFVSDLRKDSKNAKRCLGKNSPLKI